MPGRRGLQRAHLGAHGRTVGDVVGHEGSAILVPARGEVGVEQRARFGPRTVGAQVHRQERDVRHRIGTGIPRRELDAVDDREFAGLEQVHVLEPQVAVRLAGHALRARGARCGARCASSSASVSSSRRRSSSTDASAPACGASPAKLSRQFSRTRSNSAQDATSGPRLARGVETGELPPDALEDAVLHGAVPHLRRERRRLGEATHVDRVLDRFALPAEDRASVLLRDRHDAHVHAGRETAVQGDLGLAHDLATCERRVVEEPEVDRLLELVDVVPGENDRGSVGLHEYGRARRARVGARVEQVAEDRVEVHEGDARTGSAQVPNCTVTDPVP